ncbi:MAG TPA: hypothetical protein QGI71_10855 [Dehalococcoidia bacterium]|nr:hypothetical protein [Dehalococcoidia bacterium]
MRRPSRPSPELQAAALALLIATALWAGLFALRHERAGDEFDALQWEVASIANKWLYAAGSPLRGDPPPDEAIASYFAATDRAAPAAARLENAVEAAIESRIDAVLRTEGVRGRFSLFGPLAVWPPVDIELSLSPRILVTSPRDRIERLDATRLRADLTTEQAVALEQATEADDPALSSLVVATGGIAFYPAIVSNRNGYATTVETAAHEWVHHYMGFYPLGFGVPTGDRQVISETVADHVGDEVAALMIERFGDPTSAPTPGRASGDSPTTETLRDLRNEVEALLAESRIEDAERRMEEVRQALEAEGVHIRRINQAFFAWTDIYAARPDSIDLLGDQIRTLRTATGSLAAFIELLRGTTTRDDIERLIEALETR